jgi:signal transduction histidine kinase
MRGVLRVRGRGLDCVLVLLAAAEVASVLAGTPRHEGAAAVLSAVSALVLLARRWQPLAVTLTAFAALTALDAVMPQGTVAQFFGVLLTFAVAGAVNLEREAVVAWLGGAGMVAYASFVNPFGGGFGDFALTLAFGTMLTGAGLLVARRGRQTEAAELRAKLAVRERQEQARRAVAEERARIARELHDVVSHGLSVVVLQTLAARAALQDGGPVDRHLDAVEDTAREALGEMRRMLGLLQSEDLDGGTPARPSSPAPGVRSLPELLDRARTTVRITSADVDATAVLPAGVDLTAYRVVQESLTNAAKHAAGSAVDVTVHVSPEELLVRVVNGPGRSATGVAGAGHGLAGMRQRVGLYDGTLTAGPTPDGGFAVTAILPLADTARIDAHQAGARDGVAP